MLDKFVETTGGELERLRAENERLRAEKKRLRKSMMAVIDEYMIRPGTMTLYEGPLTASINDARAALAATDGKE